MSLIQMEMPRDIKRYEDQMEEIGFIFEAFLINFISLRLWVGLYL